MAHYLKVVTDENIGEIIEDMELFSLLQASKATGGHTEMDSQTTKRGFFQRFPRLTKRAPLAKVSFLHLGAFAIIASISTLGATQHFIEKQNEAHAIASTITTTKIKINLHGLKAEKVDLRQVSSDSYECSAMVTGQGSFAAYSLDMGKACALLMDKLEAQANKKPEIMI